FTCQLTKDGAIRIATGEGRHDARGQASRPSGTASGVDRARYDPALLATSAGTFGRADERWSDHVGVKRRPSVAVI
ncbi:MAG: hypothetical protein AVDCRST_MAG21-244, partial [uncultured Nocardioidaceae bacterium]